MDKDLSNTPSTTAQVLSLPSRRTIHPGRWNPSEASEALSDAELRILSRLRIEGYVRSGYPDEKDVHAVKSLMGLMKDYGVTERTVPTTQRTLRDVCGTFVSGVLDLMYQRFVDAVEAHGE